MTFEGFINSHQRSHTLLVLRACKKIIRDIGVWRVAPTYLRVFKGTLWPYVPPRLSYPKTILKLSLTKSLLQLLLVLVYDAE